MSRSTGLRSLATCLGAALALNLAAVGCGDDEHVDPAGGGGGEAATSAVSSTAATSVASSGAGGDPVDPVRTILTRDPFGNVAETRNLLWDGDFEWESAFADQYGWLQGQTANVTDRRVGPECRSGLKCGVLGEDLIGIGVSSADHDLYASVWVRPGDGTCASVEVYLLAQGIYEDGDTAPIPTVAATPDETGWCHFEVTAPQRDDKTYLYLTSASPQVSLVDDAVIREVDGDEARRVARLPAWAPDAARAEKLDRARLTIRKWRGPHEGAPNPAREAAQRWARGEGRSRYHAAPPTQQGGPR